MSGDPMPGLLPRAGKRLMHFGRSDTLWPIEAESAWDAGMKDRRNWYRIAPGATRTVHRRIAAAGTGSEMKPLLAYASQANGPAVQLVPSGRTPAVRTVAKVAEAQASPPAPPPAQATESPIAASKASMVVGVNPDKAPATPPKPAKPAEQDGLVAVPADDAPKVINELTKEIQNLPPPIK
jgi:hypothetical protein